MASILVEAIPTQNFELIRDRIGGILADELASQAILRSEPDIDATVFVERVVPFSKENAPAVNVMFDSGDFSNQDTVSSDGNYTFFIDVYTSAKTTATDRGYLRSVKNLHAILGVCRAILENPVYRTLAFASPSITHTNVAAMNIKDPSNDQDAASIAIGRLTFRVRVPEGVQLINANNIAGYITSVKLLETNKGYIFTENP